MTRFTEQDLQNLKDKGFKINDPKEIKAAQTKPKKIVKISIEKNTIELFLKQFLQQGLIDDYKKEVLFVPGRRFRFDWAIMSLQIAIEYEGIFSKKSRHTTISGYTGDIEKYNLALTLGWKVLRYTAKNYLELENDLKKLL